jgi:hypothetical protein
VVPGDGSIAVVVLPADADLGTVYDLELLDRITERARRGHRDRAPSRRLCLTAAL